MAWTRVAALSEIPPDSVIEVEQGSNVFALSNHNGEIHAIDGTCPHEGGPLGQGNLVNGMVICPFHTWEFDAKTGVCLVDDCFNVKPYPVKVEDGSVLIDIG